MLVNNLQETKQNIEDKYYIGGHMRNNNNIQTNGQIISNQMMMQNSMQGPNMQQMAGQQHLMQHYSNHGSDRMINMRSNSRDRER